MNHIRHAKKRRECDLRKLASLPVVRSGQAFRIDVLRRLFIEPHTINRWPLPLLAALLISFKGDDRRSRLDIATTPPTEPVRCREGSLCQAHDPNP